MTNGVVSTFSPTEQHTTALREFIRSGGSVRAAASASGLSVPMVLRAQRTRWWQDRLKEDGFIPLTVEELGEALQMEAGHIASEIVAREGDSFDLDDTLKLARLGETLRSAGTGGARGAARIEVLARLDLRGLSADALRALRGTRENDAMTDVIDAEFTVDDG